MRLATPGPCVFFQCIYMKIDLQTYHMDYGYSTWSYVTHYDPHVYDPEYPSLGHVGRLDPREYDPWNPGLHVNREMFERAWERYSLRYRGSKWALR